MAGNTNFLIVLVCLAQVHGSFSWLFGNTCPNEWDKLTVTFPRFYDMPMTKAEAESDGWTKDDLACDGHSYFVGNRYSKGDDVMLYDNNGAIAGIQGKLDPSTVVPKKYSDMVTLDNGVRYVTAYFTEPATICSAQSQGKKDCVGKKLIIQTGQTPLSLARIPLKEDAIAATSWTKGKCFIGMGQHYWHNITNDMSCDDFFPVFLLYNGGNLNAFGWAFGGDAKNGHFEHPPNSLLGLFFDSKTQPKCLSSFKIRSTQHIYFQSSNFKYSC